MSVSEIKDEPVGIWVRVSAGGQDEANQLPDILRYCADRGYKIERRYELHGRSASKGQHQGKLDEMLEDMRQGAIKVLVCWWSDRIERRGPEALFRLLRLTRDAGGRIESTHEPLLGSGDISGEAMTELNAVMAHYESIKIAERIKKGHDRIKANGATSNRVPWGYYTEGPKYNRLMIPTDICRKYLPLILQRCIDGDSCRTIAMWLTAEGVPTVKGRPWNEGQVRFLIKNRAYAGRRTRNNDTETYQRCEAVVSTDLWERANEGLRSRPGRGPTTRGGNPLMLAKLRVSIRKSCGG